MKFCTDSCLPLADELTNGMSELHVTSSRDDEIGFMDDDDVTSSDSRHVTSSSSMTSASDVISDVDHQGNGVLESKSEIERTEKEARGMVNGEVGDNVKRSKRSRPADGASEFESELEEFGYAVDLRDSE